MNELKAQLRELHDDAFAWAMACAGGVYAEAEDVLQTVYLKILEGKAVFGGRSSLKTWLFAVIRQTAAERRRRRRYRQVLLLKWGEPPKEVAPRDEVELSERSRRVRRALGELSQRQREVLELVFYHELTIEEAAEVLGVGLGSARTHYHRGKKKMFELLKSEEPSWATETIGS